MVTPRKKPSAPVKKKRLSDEVEHELIRRILSGHYPQGTQLPLERELAVELGVGRPTLREGIQRLARDGWVTVRKGLGTTVNDFWHTGSLNILPAIITHSPEISESFIIHLLELRAALAPAYVRDAVAHQPARVVAALVDWETLEDEAEVFAWFDWKIQMELSELAPNPIYYLITKSFDSVYVDMATDYFADPVHRQASKLFYEQLIRAAMESDPSKAEAVTRLAMEHALRAWRAGER